MPRTLKTPASSPRSLQRAFIQRMSCRGCPRAFFEKYFEANGKPGCFRVVDKVRERVVFQCHDLLSFKEIGHDYSLIVCKNVLLHFRPPERVEVLKMFHRALAPSGLFVTEQTQEMPLELASLFERVIPDGQLFRKVEAGRCGS